MASNTAVLDSPEDGPFVIGSVSLVLSSIWLPAPQEA